ncbi:MAG: hypothetical protein GY739_12215 [Mesoflavibacter sp.]|nr:hypothetical protein [Mesoflavibacter sp.]
MKILYKIYFNGFNYYVDKEPRGLHILIQYFNSDPQKVHEKCEKLRNILKSKHLKK